ncbi:hypothetical protein K440DRAFT_620203, partial [Wilcoxina mikolae CBS 423.85]
MLTIRPLLRLAPLLRKHLHQQAKSQLPETPQYADFPLHRLRNEACERKLNSKGKKIEIIMRLEEDDERKRVKTIHVTDRPRIIIGKVPLRVRN